MNFCQDMIFRVYSIYNKHEKIKIGNKTREKSQVVSQVLEEFFFQLWFTFLTMDDLSAEIWLIT